jgi:adenosine deaminase CECR1
MVGAPTMTLYSWKQLARWSIDYSCLSKKHQVEGHKILNEAWKKFCSEIVKEYGPLMEGDEFDEAKAKAKYSEPRNPKRP